MCVYMHVCSVSLYLTVRLTVKHPQCETIEYHCQCHCVQKTLKLTPALAAERLHTSLSEYVLVSVSVASASEWISSAGTVKQ